jgi:DNA-binding HxlR family transcriptional regulator
MKNNEIKEFSCPVTYTISIVGGKWKWIILYMIYRQGTIRYGELKKKLPPIAHKTLSQQLNELEDSVIIHRKQYNQIPPRVEYSLTEKGKSLIPILIQMAQWGEQNMHSQTETIVHGYKSSI